MGKARGCLQLLRAMVGRWRARRAARRRPFTNDSRFFHENRSPTLLIAFIRPSATLLIVRGACPTPFSNGAPFLPHTDSGQIFLLRRRRRRRKFSTLDETDLEITIDAFHSGLGPTTDSAGFKSNKAETPTVLHNATRIRRRATASSCVFLSLVLSCSCRLLFFLFLFYSPIDTEYDTGYLSSASFTIINVIRANV